MHERELREKEELTKKRKETVRVQKEQLEQWKLKKVKEVEEDMLEGAVLRRKGLEDLENEKKAQLRRRAQAVRALVETQKSNDLLKELKMEELAKQKLEEEKIRQYAEHKEEMNRLRKEREREIFQARQARRQQLIEEECARMAKSKNTEDTRISKQVAEREFKEGEERRAKDEMRKKWLEEVEESRKIMINRRIADSLRQKREEQLSSDFWKQWCQKLDQDELDDKRQKRNMAKKVSEEQLAQVWSLNFPKKN
jgi:hypothetical protein